MTPSPSPARLSQICTLERGDVDPAARTARVQAKNAKNRKAATNPISPELAAMLADYMSDNPFALPGARLFPGMWRERGADMIAADLRAAGITPRNDAGEIVDFHSLRHTRATDLANAGVPAHITKRIMRHASITTTDNFYTHADDDGLRAALAATALPSFTPAAVAMAKTGTAGEEAASEVACQGGEKRGQLYGQKMGEEWPKTANFEGGAAGLEAGGESMKKPAKTSVFAGFMVAPPAGLEPATHGLTVRCSTN